MLASPWKPEERVNKETHLVTCILYHLYTAPLNFSLPSPNHASVFLFSPLVLCPQGDHDCGKPEFVRQQADDLSSCLSERQAERTQGWLSEEE